MASSESQRLRNLMEESEMAVSDAAHGLDDQQSRIARHVLTNSETLRLWATRHADIVRPVAEVKRRTAQLVALRKAEIRVMHRMALVNHIRKSGLSGSKRDRLYAAFYGPTATTNAVLVEHRQYLLAVCSQIANDHLIGIMHDPRGKRLLGMYDAAYEHYFSLYCYVASTEDRLAADAARDAMLDARKTATRLRNRLETVRDDREHGDFDRQVLLARSGRYPVLNYMM